MPISPKKEQIVIYLGPSLSIQEAQEILNADYRPPVKRGDIDSLLLTSPLIIGIIDGEFFQNLSVSPKEILRALDSGVTVFGSSSMGALRAVELHPFGMIGIGKIFKLYKSGRLEADDEVAMIYSEDDQRALSDPMVNIRFSLQKAVEEGIINLKDKRNLTRIAKAIYFPERSYPRLLQLAAGRLSETKLKELQVYLKHHAQNTKQEDAIQMLLEIRRRVGMF